MLQILLVRSCETEYDQQGRIQGNLDIPLSEDGRRESDDVIDALREEEIDAVYNSPCPASLHIAEAVANSLDVKQTSLDMLENLDHGLWQGMLKTDVKAKQPKVYRQWQEQPETVCPPEGETIRAAKARVATVLNKLIKKHKDDSKIAIVVPEPLTSIFRHVLRSDDLGNFWHTNNGAESPRWEWIAVAPELVGSR